MNPRFLLRRLDRFLSVMSTHPADRIFGGHASQRRHAGERGKLTMSEATQTGFILAAYTTAAIVVAGLCLWVMLDYRAQRRRLADLERRGVTRRSAAARPAPQRAKEEA